ncbi:MAG: DUF1659 domain-containing protein [Veillonellales bacterium]
MAVNKVAQSTRLVVKVQTGTNAAGNPVYRQRSFTNTKASAADSDVYAIGQGLGSLQKYPVISISRLDENTLVNQ